MKEFYGSCGEELAGAISARKTAAHPSAGGCAVGKKRASVASLAATAVGHGSAGVAELGGGRHQRNDWVVWQSSAWPEVFCSNDANLIRILPVPDFHFDRRLDANPIPGNVPVRDFITEVPLST